MKGPMRALRRASALMVALALISASPAFAQDGAVSPHHPVARKLGRGLSNLLFSALEIPMHISEVRRADGPFAGATLGLVSGVGSAAARTLAGAVEVVTCPFPLPRAGYGPMLRPEFLLEPGSPLLRQLSGDP